MNKFFALLGALGAWEMFWWADRVRDRHQLYDRAKAHARALGLPLIVVGAPDQGPTPGPGCGDLCLDIAPSACPCSMQVDITKPIPLPDDSAVIFVSCVLEYVGDFNAAWRELQRIAPNRVYVCRVQPWTLTAQLYPGAQRTLDKRMCEPQPEAAPQIRRVPNGVPPHLRDPSWVQFASRVAPGAGGVAGIGGFGFGGDGADPWEGP
jgi:hypothetical protein